MQIPVNKDLDSFKDDFFKGLTLKQTALSIVSVAAGTGTFLLGSYVFHLSQNVSFYLALPVVLPIAASGFLRIHGMTPLEYLKRRRGTVSMDTYHFVPELIMYPEKEEKPKAERAKNVMLDDDRREDLDGI